MPISLSDTVRKPIWAKVSQVIFSGLTSQSHSCPPSSTPVSSSLKPFIRSCLILSIQVSFTASGETTPSISWSRSIYFLLNVTFCFKPSFMHKMSIPCLSIQKNSDSTLSMKFFSTPQTSCSMSFPFITCYSFGVNHILSKELYSLISPV